MTMVWAFIKDFKVCNSSHANCGQQMTEDYGQQHLSYYLLLSSVIPCKSALHTEYVYHCKQKDFQTGHLMYRPLFNEL